MAKLEPTHTWNVCRILINQTQSRNWHLIWFSLKRGCQWRSSEPQRDNWREEGKSGFWTHPQVSSIYLRSLFYLVRHQVCAFKDHLGQRSHTGGHGMGFQAEGEVAERRGRSPGKEEAAAASPDGPPHKRIKGCGILLPKLLQRVTGTQVKDGWEWKLKETPWFPEETHLFGNDFALQVFLLHPHAPTDSRHTAKCEACETGNQCVIHTRSDSKDEGRQFCLEPVSPLCPAVRPSLVPSLLTIRPLTTHLSFISGNAWSSNAPTLAFSFPPIILPVIITSFSSKKAQLVKCLLCKHGDLSPVPKTPNRKLSMVACACNPNAEKIQINNVVPWGSLAIKPGLDSQRQASETPCLKKQEWRFPKNDIQDCPLASTCT